MLWWCKILVLLCKDNLTVKVNFLERKKEFKWDMVTLILSGLYSDRNTFRQCKVFLQLLQKATCPIAEVLAASSEGPQLFASGFSTSPTLEISAGGWREYEYHRLIDGECLINYCVYAYTTIFLIISLYYEQKNTQNLV